MTVLALTGGDIALIVLACGWVVLVLWLSVVLLNTFRLLESTKMIIDAFHLPAISRPSSSSTNLHFAGESIELPLSP